MIEADSRQGQEGIMKKVDAEMDDELRSEYDLRNLRVRKVGPKRKGFKKRSIQFETDGATVFPNSKSR